MDYRINEKILPEEIAALRISVGWNAMLQSYKKPEMQHFLEIGCYEEKELIGYLCVVSNRVTDAYIQDVMVHPIYQGRGIGSELMRLALDYIRQQGIYMTSVIYGEEELRAFYEKFGFYTMLCGQMETGGEYWLIQGT